MIRTIKKLTALLLTFALVFALLPSNAQAAGESTNTAVFQKGKTLHILAVGNSFSVDGLHYLYQMAESAGYDVVIGNLYKSGCDLKNPWRAKKQPIAIIKCRTQIRGLGGPPQSSLSPRHCRTSSGM